MSVKELFDFLAPVIDLELSSLVDSVRRRGPESMGRPTREAHLPSEGCGSFAASFPVPADKDFDAVVVEVVLTLRGDAVLVSADVVSDPEGGLLGSAFDAGQRAVAAKLEAPRSSGQWNALREEIEKFIRSSEPVVLAALRTGERPVPA